MELELADFTCMVFDGFPSTRGPNTVSKIPSLSQGREVLKRSCFGFFSFATNLALPEQLETSVNDLFKPPRIKVGGCS